MSDHSEQILADIGQGVYRYAGGDVWFQERKKPRGYYNCATRAKAAALPDSVVPFKGGDDELPVEVLRLEVLRRDKERLRVASQVR
jgi:hypothetical protein